MKEISKSNKGKLWFMCGLPRSGKSTESRLWQLYLNDNSREKISDYSGGIDEVLSQKRIVINGDSTRLALTGEVYAKESESTVFAHIEVIIRALLNEGHHVLFDETNTSVLSLINIYKLDIEAIPIIINTSSKICIERAISLNQEYLIPIINRCKRNLEFLTSLEHNGTIESGVKVIQDFVKQGKSVTDIMKILKKDFY